ncbi:MAG: nickel-responsive transcriptional regulator NikR [Thermoplasmata archaeon]|jgi:CopG family nickel-responsive transcriptional regulator|nr:nickel-responsive transcriptional regulator NikR [Thermoplasmata archaeon]
MKRVRISFTIPEDIMKKFESTFKKMGYKNRSHAISMAIHDYIVAHKWTELKGKISGAILLTYEHHGKINDDLVDVQHHYNDIINASMHIHLNRDNCLEIIAFTGDARKVKELFKKLQGMGGVISIKMVTAA